MKIIAFLTVALLLSSCVPKKEVFAPPPPTVMPPVRQFKKYLNCSENTDVYFNRCGIESLPFARTAFFDMDNDGNRELIIGGKDDLLRMYRYDAGRIPHWLPVNDYFRGISPGAFLSPAVADINGDGIPEIAVGTGGFSNNSGRVLFYRNTGTAASPSWELMRTPEIAVGNDATPVMYDIDNDGRQDLIIGNSEGKLFLFRNKSDKRKISFVQDTDFFKDIDLGMYVAPAVTSDDNTVVIIAGNSMGKLYRLEKRMKNNSPWDRQTLDITLDSFASPVFTDILSSGRKDIIVSDGSGRLHYFVSRNNALSDWEESRDIFNERILPGPACTPALTEINGRTYMVVGNRQGDIRLYEYNHSEDRLPWAEITGVFSRIKLSSFSRGIVTVFDGRELLITAQHDGILKAFLNFGTVEEPSWTEQTRFFEALPNLPHAAPSVFDLDGDGKWELIIGSSDGSVQGFFYKVTADGSLIWEPLPDSLSRVRVARFAAPAPLRDGDTLYLLVGQQDGRIAVFTAQSIPGSMPVFYVNGHIDTVQVINHSSPSALIKNGVIELTVGDYDGNLKHFACRQDLIEIE